MKEGFFLKYIQNVVIDIGCGDNPVSDECVKYDTALGNTDATYMEGLCDCVFDTVYSYHCLEHLEHPELALKNWYRLVKPGGWLIIGVPHRDYYEKRKLLPSLFNPDHKTFWLPIWDEPPDTRGLLQLFLNVLGNSFCLHSLRVLDDGYIDDKRPNTHPVGEYTIEIIVRRV